METQQKEKGDIFKVKGNSFLELKQVFPLEEFPLPLVLVAIENLEFSKKLFGYGYHLSNSELSSGKQT